MDILKIIGAILILLIGIGVILYVLLRKSPVKPEVEAEETLTEEDEGEGSDEGEDSPEAEKAEDKAETSDDKE